MALYGGFGLYGYMSIIRDLKFTDGGFVINGCISMVIVNSWWVWSLWSCIYDDSKKILDFILCGSKSMFRASGFIDVFL
jgi:hypothetical protein